VDIKEYIASGIIESYALGFSSDQERREVECMSSIYPEIKAELERTQIALEAYAESISVAPPVELKNRVLEAIKGVSQDIPMNVVKPSVEKAQEAKVIRMSGMAKLSIAASVAVILTLSFLYVKQLNSSSQMSETMTAMEAEKSDLTNQLATLEASLSENSEMNAFIMHSQTNELVLAGTELSPESKVRIYYNTAVSQAVLVSDFLPTPEAGKQYQLWAIADGKPVDLGMLDKTTNVSNKINVAPKGVQAFAITLEKDGGNPTPTMDQMYVVGAVNS